MSTSNSVAKLLESLGAAAVKHTEDQGASGKKKDGSGGKVEAVELKDFTWDQFIKYISSAILVLTLLNVIEQFFRDGSVFCFHPSSTVSLLSSFSTASNEMAIYEFARDQAIFINNYCTGSVPVTEYVPLYILIHGVLLLAPHYIWSSVFKGDFDGFFAIEGKIDHLRDSTTGEYKEESFDHVKKLEKEYGAGHKKIFHFYILKLIAQLMVCIASIAFSAVWLKDFSYTFNCPRSLEENTDIPDEWPLNVTVPCVYTSLRILRVVRVADFVLTAVVAILTLYGLFWCGIRHTDELGHYQVAKFSFQSGLRPEAFSADPIIQFKSNKYYGIIMKHFDANWFFRGLFWLFTWRVIRIRPQNFLSQPRISNDLDFLVMLLFKAEASRGKVFKNLLIDKELRHLTGRDQQLLHLYINIQRDMKEEEFPSLRKIEEEIEKGELEDRGTDKDVSEEEEEERNRGCLCCWRRRRAIAHFRLNDQGTGPASNGTASNHMEQLRQRSNRSLTAQEVINEEIKRHDIDDQPHKRLPCCLNCLLKCFGRFLTRRKSWKRIRYHTAASSNKRETGDKFRDFHDIFWQSEATNITPDAMAYFYFKKFSGNVPFKDDDLRGFRDVMYYIIQLHGRDLDTPITNNIVLEIAFGSVGYGLIAARAFKQVYAVNFHPFFRGSADQVTEFNKYYTNIKSYRYPNDFYTYNSTKITEGNKELFEILSHNMSRRESFPVDMLIVGPISEESQIITTNLFLNTLCMEGFIKKNARLLAIRPLRIGATKMKYFKFEPSTEMFEYEQKKFVHPSIEQRLIDGCRGVKINCAGISCVFEFAVFRCKKHVRYDLPAPTVSATPQYFPLAKKPTKNEETLPADHQDKQSSNDAIDGSTATRGAQLGTTSSFNVARSRSVDDKIVMLALGTATESKHRHKVSCQLDRPLRKAGTPTEV